MNRKTVSLMFSTLLASTGGSAAFAAGSMEGLGDLDGGYFESYASAISGDGTVVVGSSSGASGTEAFRWTSAGGMEGLGDLAGGSFYSMAYAVSNDGSVVVGWSISGSGPAEAFRWTEAGGMVGLGDLAGGDFSSTAFDVSSDGSVVVGQSSSGAMGGGNEAFRWTEAGGMVGLGDLPGGNSWSFARAVNSDGSVVVGASGSSLGDEAFRWTASGGMVGLGVLTGYDHSWAADVSGDGSVVVGAVQNEDTDALNAFRWTEATGMLSLAEWLARSGHTLTGWSDTQATGVSDDGYIVVGYGDNSDGNTEAFIARGGDGLIGINSFSQSLQSAGSAGGDGVIMISTILHGAHGHPGANRALGERGFVWVAGDLARDERHDSDDDFAIGELGAGYRFSDALSVSAALGKSWSDSDLLYGGSSEGDGIYLALDADLRFPGGLPLYATLTWLYSRSDLEIERGYLNAGAEDSSRGDTEQQAQALRARLQWQSAYQGGFNLHPYAEYNHIRVKTDGYTESGGGFPALYNDSSETVRDWRLGADLDKPIGEQTRLIGTLEAVHRMEKNGNGVSGQVVGLSNFEVAGRSYDQDWVRGTVGVEQSFDKNSRLSVTLNASSEGEDPQVWAGVNYSLAF